MKDTNMILINVISEELTTKKKQILIQTLII